MKTFIGYFIVCIVIGAPAWYVPLLLWLAHKSATEPTATEPTIADRGPWWEDHNPTTPER